MMSRVELRFHFGLTCSFTGIGFPLLSSSSAPSFFQVILKVMLKEAIGSRVDAVISDLSSQSERFEVRSPNLLSQTCCLFTKEHPQDSMIIEA
jgi:hypothetical protein